MDKATQWINDHVYAVREYDDFVEHIEAHWMAHEDEDWREKMQRRELGPQVRLNMMGVVAHLMMDEVQEWIDSEATANNGFTQACAEQFYIQIDWMALADHHIDDVLEQLNAKTAAQ
ncbi:MAG: hypothetical protein Unbinned1529contig1001_36 [Prokaryotic dsDNA virus sp.]|nr:MAG: hypothetical protein Unbinned1529contig1001_36 [Prokaryotic dsDNA virus sp.]|tara:strand:+ start:1051 stop:1401 length:351 start_codon:yes stop_codon:yes gene_type:complete